MLMMMMLLMMKKALVILMMTPLALEPSQGRVDSMRRRCYRKQTRRTQEKESESTLTLCVCDERDAQR